MITPKRPQYNDRDTPFVRDLKGWGREVVDSFVGTRGDGRGISSRDGTLSFIPEHHPFQLVRGWSGSESTLSWKIRGGAITTGVGRCVPANIDGRSGDDLRALHAISDSGGLLSSAAFTVWAICSTTASGAGMLTYSTSDTVGDGYIAIKVATLDGVRVEPHLTSEITFGGSADDESSSSGDSDTDDEVWVVTNVRWDSTYGQLIQTKVRIKAAALETAESIILTAKDCPDGAGEDESESSVTAGLESSLSSVSSISSASSISSISSVSSASSASSVSSESSLSTASSDSSMSGI